MNRRLVVSSIPLVISMLCIVGAGMAQEVQDGLSSAAAANDAARRSQANIDRVVDETEALARQYSAMIKENLWLL